MFRSPHAKRRIARYGANPPYGPETGGSTTIFRRTEKGEFGGRRRLRIGRTALQRQCALSD